MREYAVFISLLLISLCSCEKPQSDPMLITPSAGIASVQSACPQIDNSAFPNCRAFLSITDQFDNPLTSFAIGNFCMLENGKPAVVYDVSKVDNIADPLYVVLCMDRSGSMIDWSTTQVNTAAIALIDSLGYNDSMEIINFTYTDKAQLAPSQEFTTDKALLKDAINIWTSGSGNTPLYDVTVKAAEYLSAKKGRKFIIVMTDGEDTASESFSPSAPESPQLCADAVNGYGVAAYMVSFGPGVNADALNTIASETGARYYAATLGSEVADSFNEILNLMQNLVQVKFCSRMDGLRELKIILNYGSFSPETTRKYSS